MSWWTRFLLALCAAVLLNGCVPSDQDEERNDYVFRA